MDVIKYISNLLTKAIESRASDIHIEPQEKDLRIRQRIDGFIVQVDTCANQYAAAIASRLKVMANLDIGERRMPQDGAMKLNHNGTILDIRISTIPTLFGEKVVLRILRNNRELLSLERLGIEEPEKSRLGKLLTRTSGLMIVTGPTGSGKTTTLYAMLQILNKLDVNVVTLEDPIELQLDGITQVQINPKSGLTFAQGLRAMLRQDPNIIMIGEIRDKETVDIAISAALTGHLVLSTLHTVDGASAVTRLLDMQIEPYRVAAALSGIVAQRLFRLLCKKCNGHRCAACQGTGYWERSGVFEVIDFSEEFQQFIVNNNSLSELRKFCRVQGTRSLYDAAMEKMHRNDTTREEMLRVMSQESTAKVEGL